ncbi:hypothetical protein RJ639_044369 [Escallonia herrerae]|uniref:Uncharacterized protein n=1 Tax=Escallonia herrerae TaxID=1293975 RepID=A0AA89B4V8_9ASTE|nr:hypothetical protein RJ639_044369 [Escallonia herrerae]
MNAESLFASAAINIGLALVTLSVFSILKKQPSNAPIYFARRLSLGQAHDIIFPRSTLHRLLPSIDWIRRALRVTEDEIIQTCGLDALILIKVFKFGSGLLHFSYFVLPVGRVCAVRARITELKLNFFVVCSLVGLLVLLPLNYSAYYGYGTQAMDSFTISNISSGSNRLWVHFSCLCFISCYGLYLLHKEYNDIVTRRIEQLHNMRDRPEQFTILVRQIPLCDDHKAYSCCVDHFFSKHHPYAYRSNQILYDGKNLEDLLNRAKSISKRVEDLRKRPSTKKPSRGTFLTDELRDDAKIERLEEMLQETCLKIRHFRCKKFLEQKELPVGFVTFTSRWGASLAAQSQQHSNPLIWITEKAPEPRDVLWRNLGIPYRRLPLYQIGVFIAASLLTIFFAIPVAAVQGIAKFEMLRKWFPPAIAVQLIPGLRSVVTGYLPSVILSGFIYVVPFAMIAMAESAGYVSRSQKDIRACNMVFYFLVGNVFFLSLLSGSLLDQIGKSFMHPKDFPARLASAVSAQADFFMTYILTSGLSGFSLEILQPGLLMWDTLKSHTWSRGKKKSPYLYSIPYYRVIPFVALFIMIGMVYAVVAPLLLPFLIGYFLLGYVVFINQIQDVYETTYETFGQYWPYIHHYILLAIIITQITMIGLFGLKSKPSASFASIPLLVFTIAFNEYCKIRFFPTFCHYSVQEKNHTHTIEKTPELIFFLNCDQDAMKDDELDRENGLMEANCQNALDAYLPPCLRPENLGEEESSSTRPRICSNEGAVEMAEKIMTMHEHEDLCFPGCEIVTASKLDGQLRGRIKLHNIGIANGIFGVDNRGVGGHFLREAVGKKREDRYSYEIRALIP